jgi:hypothetical protein
MEVRLTTMTTLPRGRANRNRKSGVQSPFAGNFEMSLPIAELDEELTDEGDSEGGASESDDDSDAETL